MKSYHLTQEQALNLLVGLPIQFSKSDDGTLITILGADSLQAYLNAALDQVLGEPVATKRISDPDDERDGLWFDLEDIARMKALKAGTILYAPRKLK